MTRPLLILSLIAAGCTTWQPIQSFEREAVTLRQERVRVTTEEGGEPEPFVFETLDGQEIVGQSEDGEPVRIQLGDVDEAEVERTDHVMNAVAFGVPALALLFGVVAAFVIDDAINNN